MYIEIVNAKHEGGYGHGILLELASAAHVNFLYFDKFVVNFLNVPVFYIENAQKGFCIANFERYKEENKFHNRTNCCHFL